MAMFATIGGSITFYKSEDLRAANEVLQNLGEVNERGLWVLSQREDGPKALNEDLLSIEVPRYSYKNLYASLKELLEKSPRHLIVWTSSDGVFEGGVFEDGSYVNYCLKNWGEKKGIVLPDDQDLDIGKRAKLMEEIENLFFKEFLTD